MNKAIVAGGVAGLFLVGALALVSLSSSAGETVIVRGIVKGGGDADTMSVFYTFVHTAADKSKLLGVKADVKVSGAKIYRWQVSKGKLIKKQVPDKPTPGKEVVIKGTLRGDDDPRIIASWVVENYRDYKMTGTLTGKSTDAGVTNAGYLTVKVSTLVLKGTKPEQKFKEAKYKDVDVRVRFDSLTTFTSNGVTKQADELTASQQKVTIEGEFEDESTFTAAKVKE